MTVSKRNTSGTMTNRSSRSSTRVNVSSKGPSISIREISKTNRPKSEYTTLSFDKKKQVSSVLKKSLINTKIIHVLPYDTSWIIRREGSKRATKVVKNKNDAILYAKKIANNLGSSKITIHKANGMVDRRINVRTTTRL